ncbi:DNA-binding response regulator [Paenibacillus sp. NEAU-GSW1]|uniref:DNA-binding response regulator n=1 Tax=Paenibacillus sp. NEAU-GSW1 TaxID=2682486 RepID=UPI0012E2B738|nr:DNA-binding response regulator [Paenibacillus sp. NEAU-GSW1]MUT66185.1 DNA-binding response regulator [Paenibacillus sp. NEAU-GSW1]
MVDFQQSYDRWYIAHVRKRKGEAARRLVDALGHAEKLFVENVWFPAFEELNDLHPEYEVSDFKDGTRFIDFAYIKNGIRLAIEIDGFKSHAADLNRWQFSDSRMRQNHLILDGWSILRFSYDDMKDKPMTCIQLLRQFMGSRRLLPDYGDGNSNRLLEREVLRLALHLGRPIKPIDIQTSLQIGRRKTESVLSRLQAGGYLSPLGDGPRNCLYELNRQQLRHML